MYLSFKGSDGDGFESMKAVLDTALDTMEPNLDGPLHKRFGKPRPMTGLAKVREVLRKHAVVSLDGLAVDALAALVRDDPGVKP
jgi:hypothetical protein